MNSAPPNHADLATHAQALADTVRAGGRVAAGRLFGLPELPDDDYWVDMAGATALTGVPPKTITSWLARGGPVRNPFPAPQRLLYRLYWRGNDIGAWLTQENATLWRRGPSSYL